MVRFRPDPRIFTSTEIDTTYIRRRLHDVARLYPHLRVWFQEERLEGHGGIAEWALQLAEERGKVVQHFAVVQTIGETHVNIAIAWNASGAPFLRSFCNLQQTSRGSHADGMWSGFCEYARGTSSLARGNAHVREAIGCGMVAVIHVTTPCAQYTSLARDELRSPEVADAVRAAVLASIGTESQWWSWQSWTRRFLDERLLVKRTR